MSHNIGGRLGAHELLTLTGDSDEARMKAFHILSRAEQASAIGRLHQAGYSDNAIAAATKLSVEFIRRVLAERGMP